MTMKYRHLLVLSLLALPMICFSQNEMKDSIPFGQNKNNGISVEAVAKPDSIYGEKNRVDYHLAYPPVLDPIFPYRLAQPLDFHIPNLHLHFTPGQAGLLIWNSGEIIAAGGTRALPGLMQIDSGTLGFYQSIGNFTFYAGGMVNKYAYFCGLNTQYCINGSITYQFTPKLSATVFGDYCIGQPPQMTNGMPMPPAMIGYYGRSAFGGYLDYRINERWGVQTGIQTVQQVGTNRYQAEPIVTPYYKINKKVSIGLPIGLILYHILKR